jgi:MoaA/NifB/PqqE/SkfB family radical SAM enzyme
MHRELAFEALSEINKLKITKIGIAGGEPFVERDLMRTLVNKAASYGMTVIAVTNAYWATSQRAALNKLRDLRRSGLTWIQISLDDQHQQFVPITRVANALKAAIALDFEDIKLIGSSKGNSERFKYQLFYLQEVLATYIHNVDIIDRPRISHKYFQDSHQVRYSFEELENTESLDLPVKKPGDCLTELMVDVNGDIYPCCNNFIGRIGNVCAENLSSLIGKLKSNRYFNMIKRTSPFELAKYLDLNLNTNFRGKQYGSWCELCARIFQNERFSDLLTDEHSPIINTSPKRHITTCTGTKELKKHG